MDRFLKAIVDFIAVMYGDSPDRPPDPTPLPPALPPATPAPPLADPNEPQDAADIAGDEPVVINHEGEPIRPGGADLDFAPAPAPPPASVGDPPDQSEPDRPPRPPSPEHRARYMWCIDNGHGALTRGKRSPVLEDGRQLFEYEFNRDVAYKIFARLDLLGVAYYEVVPEVQVGNFLQERVRRANQLSSALPKLFVSIHANAGPAPSLQDYTHDSARGIETWFYHGSTTGRKMAAIFQRHLIEKTGANNRHLRSKVSGQFYVLRATRMPAILTESGFYNNRFELPVMLTDAYRRKIAEAHIAAIMEIEREGL